jgi:hypothetical protein
MPNETNIAPQSREELQRIVVRLLVIAGRCTDPSTQGDLMLLTDELVKIIDDEIKE